MNAHLYALSPDEDPKTQSRRASPALAFTHSSSTILTRKTDRHILPFILLAYLFQQLDKSTLGYATVFGISDDAHLAGKQLSWLGSVLYLAQLLAQPLAAAILVKFPLGKVIGIAIGCWGCTLCLMSRCTGFEGLLVTRFILGTFESIIAPGCLAITQMWWGKEEQTLRVSSWNAMNGIAPIVGGIMCYVLGHIETDHYFTYQIIFFTVGCLTICLSIPVFLYLPDTPSDASFLTAKEKQILNDRLQSNRAEAAQKKVWKWDQVEECLEDPKTWCWVAMHTFIAIPSGGMGIFGGLIIKDFGFDKFQTILFNIPFGLVQLICILGSAVLATRLSRKGPVIMLLCCGPVLGCLMLLGVPHTPNHRTLLLFAYLMVQMMSSITPLNLTWQAHNTAGETKKQFTTAMMFVGACFGNVIGPLFYDQGQAPLYAFGLTSSMVMFGAVAGTALLTYGYLRRLNSKRRTSKGQYGPVREQTLEEIEDADVTEDDYLAGAMSPARLDLTDLQDSDYEYAL